MSSPVQLQRVQSQLFGIDHKLTDYTNKFYRWLFTLIIISSYTAQLAAFLTGNNFQYPFKLILHLVERMSTPVESCFAKLLFIYP